MTTTEFTTPKKPSRRRWLIFLAAVVLVPAVGLAALLLWNKSASEKFAKQIAHSPPADSDVKPTAKTPPADLDAHYRKLIVGTWTDHYQGKRTMTLREDGTGSMIVELSGWQAALSASKLKFNLKWSVAAGHFKEQTLGGEPAMQVKMITSTMGDHVDQPILELTDDRLLLLDGDGKTKYDWKRLKAP
jgi:hypothetical protein